MIHEESEGEVPREEDFSFLTQINQKALQENPDLQEWRDEIIKEQIELGEEQKIFYSHFSTSERLSNYLTHLPHNIAGWSISALSPDNALIKYKSGNKALPSSDILNYFIIDPFRLPGIRLDTIAEEDDMRALIDTERQWLQDAKPVSSGKVLIGQDGRVRGFQSVTSEIKDKTDKHLPQDRAALQKYTDIFALTDAYRHATSHLDEQAVEIGTVIKKHTGAIKVLLNTKQSSVCRTFEQVKGKIIDALSQKNKNTFAVKKAILDYLVKMGQQPQYDVARAIQCLRWISNGYRDRTGKSDSIELLRIQTIALTHAHRLEWQALYVTDTMGKIDLKSSLDRVGSDEKGFISRYIPSKSTHVPEPFYSFRESWRAVDQSPTSPEDQKKLLLRQFAYILLATIKSEYAYNQGVWSLPRSIGKRLTDLQEIWSDVYGDGINFSSIRLDNQPNFIHDLKACIQGLRELS